MRPLELRLAHFGPYREEARVDFEALDRLFLVCGPTGAGKTTLFDALTYALYERTPGTRGSLSDQLASHHAPEGSVPRVSLRFALGAQQWRVTRHLKHKIPRQRGGGWREQDAQVLLERDAGGTWEPIPGKRSEINARIEDLLGLSAEEFSKIVVLPQGDFQRFLEASSSDRESMLQKLFPVEPYEALATRFKARAKVLEDERRKWEDRWEQLTEKLGVHSDLATLEEAQAAALAVAREAATQEATTAATLERFKVLGSDWQQLLAKRHQALALEGRRASTDADRRKLEAGRQARSWVPDLDRQDRILAEGKAVRAEQDAAQTRLSSAHPAWERWEAESGLRQDREAQVAHLQGQRALLETQKRHWEEGQGLKDHETDAQNREAEALKALNAATEARVAAEAEVPAPLPGPGWEEALAALAEARAGHDQARRRAEAAALEHELNTELISAIKAVQETQNQTNQADREVALWNQLAEAVRAAAFAQTLSPGQPCPVCGSVEHPRPATTTTELSEVPRRLEEALGAQSLARSTQAIAQSRVEDLQRRIAGLRPEPDGPPVDVATRTLAEAEATVDGLQTHSRRWEETRGQLSQAQEAEARAREAWQAAARAREVWSTRRAGWTETVPQDPGPLLQSTLQEQGRLQRQIEADRQQGERLREERQRLLTQIEGQERQLVAFREEFARLKQTLDEGLGALGWTEADLREARLPEPTLAALERSVADFDRESHRLEGEILVLEQKFSSGEPPAWEPLAEELDRWRQVREAADADAREKGFALRNRESLETELREVSRAQGDLEAEFQRVVPIAQALDGHNRLNLKLTTWVLIQALEAIARSASDRLASMSGGRYALKVQTRGSDGRRDWGLDLAVVDGYTGQERAVGTLSGGEKFMTSISLALGLADVIQERAGGLKLEAIFIDEGFGTLDDQSLDRAMAILHELGKNRSVGLISHVAELRQRIGSRIEVVKGRQGSTLKVG